MALAKRISIDSTKAFPYGLGIRPTEEGLSAVTPVADFDAPANADGTRPQQLDKETGLPLWQVTALDFDPAASKKDLVVTVKIAAKVQPVPPANTSVLPFTPVEFVGLTALPYVDDSGPRPRIAWSFRAEGMREPGTKTSPKAAA
jgi:hypothetical protein